MYEKGCKTCAIYWNLENIAEWCWFRNVLWWIKRAEIISWILRLLFELVPSVCHSCTFCMVHLPINSIPEAFWDLTLHHLPVTKSNSIFTQKRVKRCPHFFPVWYMTTLQNYIRPQLNKMLFMFHIFISGMFHA